MTNQGNANPGVMGLWVFPALLAPVLEMHVLSSKAPSVLPGREMRSIVVQQVAEGVLCIPQQEE
jgi:hypothetical protein